MHVATLLSDAESPGLVSAVAPAQAPAAVVPPSSRCTADVEGAGATEAAPRQQQPPPHPQPGPSRCAPPQLNSEVLQTAMAHLLQLHRSGNAAEVQKMIEAARKLGVNVDLAAGRWSTADGRKGATDPFSIEMAASATPIEPLD